MQGCAYWVTAIPHVIFSSHAPQKFLSPTIWAIWRQYYIQRKHWTRTANLQLFVSFCVKSTKSNHKDSNSPLILSSTFSIEPYNFHQHDVHVIQYLLNALYWHHLLLSFGETCHKRTEKTDYWRGIRQAKSNLSSRLQLVKRRAWFQFSKFKTDSGNTEYIQ
jgi:hypothetical protein